MTVMLESSIVADRPWSWAVAAACGWNFLWVAMLKRSGAVIFAALISECHTSREQAAWVFSINASVSALIGPLVGILTKCFSTKGLSLFGSLLLSVGIILCFVSTNFGALVFLLGICSGVGTAVAMFVVDIIICQHFQRYRASATGLSHMGGTLAALAFPLLLQMLVNSYGLKGTLLITGGLSLNSLAGSLLFSAPPSSSTASNDIAEHGNGGLRDAPQATTLESKADRLLHKNSFNSLQRVSKNGNNLTPVSEKECGAFSPEVVHSKNCSVPIHVGWLSHLEFLKVADFYLALLVHVCMNYILLVLVVMVDFAGEKGFSKEQGAAMLSVSAIGDALAKLLSGFVCDRDVLDKRTMLSVSLVTAGAVCFAFPCLNSYPASLMLCVLVGWTLGTFWVLINPFTADAVGLRHLGMAMGLSMLISGLASFGCAKLTGYFKDNVGSYAGLFYVVGSGSLATGALWIVQAVRVKLTEADVRPRKPRAQFS